MKERLIFKILSKVDSICEKISQNGTTEKNDFYRRKECD